MALSQPLRAALVCVAAIATAMDNLCQLQLLVHQYLVSCVLMAVVVDGSRGALFQFFPIVGPGRRSVGQHGDWAISGNTCVRCRGLWCLLRNPAFWPDHRFVSLFRVGRERCNELIDTLYDHLRSGRSNFKQPIPVDSAEQTCGSACETGHTQKVTQQASKEQHTEEQARKTRNPEQRVACVSSVCALFFSRLPPSGTCSVCIPTQNELARCRVVKINLCGKSVSHQLYENFCEALDLPLLP